MRIRYLWLVLAVMILLLAAVVAASPGKVQLGICHTCKCDSKAVKCVNYCGTKKMCVMACSHDCKMKAAGIKKCPVPVSPSQIRAREAEEGQSPDLTQFYNDTNVRYFSARLPEVDVIDNKANNSPNLGETVPCGEHCYIITIYSRLVPDKNEQKMVVLHEMCHVDLEEEGIEEFNQHGPIFQTCMVRLAEKGAFTSLW